ncbi:MAG: hypothetical protein M1840_007301 [Geoglossum simile]|nr:MAG: hypothetical protein M1840_007301 [Geoglossum simile]
MSFANRTFGPPDPLDPSDPLEVALYVSEISSALHRLPRLCKDKPPVREWDRRPIRSRAPRFKGRAIWKRFPLPPQGDSYHGGLRPTLVISPETKRPVWAVFATWDYVGDGDKRAKRRLLSTSPNLESIILWKQHWGGYGRIDSPAATSAPEADRKSNDGEPNSPPPANIEATTHLEKDKNMLKSFVDRVKAQKVAKAAEGGRRGYPEPLRKPLGQLDKNSPQKTTVSSTATNDKDKSNRREGYSDPNTGTATQEAIPAGLKSILKVKKCIFGTRENVEGLALLTERTTKLNKGQKRIPWLILPDCGPWRRRRIPKTKSVSWNNQLASYYDSDSNFETLNSSYEGGAGYTPEQQLGMGRIERPLETVEEQSTVEPQMAENLANGPALDTGPRTESELETDIASSSQPVGMVGTQAQIGPKSNIVPGTTTMYKSATEVAPSPSDSAARTARGARSSPDIKGSDEERSKPKQKFIVISSSELVSSKQRKSNPKVEAKNRHEPKTEGKEIGGTGRVQTAKGDSHSTKARTKPPSRIPSRRGTSNITLRESRTTGSTTSEKRNLKARDVT